MNTVAMANRIKEVLDHFEIEEADCRIHMDSEGVKARLNRCKIDSTVVQSLVYESGMNFESKGYVRSFDANVYGSSFTLSTKKEQKAKDGFGIELTIEGWLVEGKSKDQVT